MTKTIADAADKRWSLPICTMPGCVAPHDDRDPDLHRGELLHGDGYRIQSVFEEDRWWIYPAIEGEFSPEEIVEFVSDLQRVAAEVSRLNAPLFRPGPEAERP